MDALFVPLVSATGASIDQLKLITCLLVSYPLGSLFIRIPSSHPHLKHVFNLSIAFFYFIPVLQLYSAFLQLLGDVLVTYVVTAVAKGPRMPWVVFAIMMGHLTVNHVIRAVYDLSYETLEVTGPQMVLVMKLTTFAWNIYDGKRPEQDLDKWQLEKRVVEHPSLLEFLGYAFYFPGVLVGPFLEFNAYTDMINGTVFKSPSGSPKEGARRRAIPAGRKRVAYRKGLYGLIYLGLWVVFSPSFYFGIAVTDWFAQQSIPFRILYIQFCGFMERSKYYGIWTLTEGASILTGLGFTGYGPSGESRWEGAANVNVRQIEFAPNFKVLLDSWNTKTNVWLRECVYKRVTPKGKKPGFRSSMITFATSAFWHGVAPGYYLTFILGGFVQTAGRLCRANLRPLVLPAAAPAPVSRVPTNSSNSSSSSDVPSRKQAPSLPPPEPPRTTLKRAYDIAGTVCAVMLVNYACMPFMLLTVQASLEAWSRLAWYGHWMVGSCLVFFYAGGRSVLRRIQAQRLKEAGATGSDNGSLVQEDRLFILVLPGVDNGVEEVEKKLE
ncbi:hypothetical protein EWM64_g3598 [Hericium alpestre]|uniref:MBOAT-domain-containing protein n=1 Tax=Hericium alpestre TaxID=135208 RepID=A0A4Z0A3G4_9AGAM|nr:hypothetical protein EWM64_g3598 [Hericium alpestre]